MNYTYDITLDMNLANDPPVVRVKQGDASARFIRVCFTEDNMPWIPDQGLSYTFRCEKPDGKAVVTYSGVIDPKYNRALITENGDGTITVELTDQVCVVIGRCYCDLCLCQGDVVLSTIPFIIQVCPTPNVANLAVSSDDFQILKSLVAHAENLEQGIAQSVGTLTLPASWSGAGSPYTQIITVSGYDVGPSTKVDLVGSPVAIETMLEGRTDEIMVINENGRLRAYAIGNAPGQEITLQACIYDTLSLDDGTSSPVVIGQPVIAAVKTEVDDAFDANSDNPVRNSTVTRWVNEPELTLYQDEETKYVYVATQDGVLLGDGILVEGGGGGGGGGGGTYTPKLSNLMESRTITAAQGSSVVLQFRYTSIDDEGDGDGPGIGTFTVNDILRQTSSIPQGENSFDITDILNTGTNTVVIVAENSEGRRATLRYTVTVVSLSVTTTLPELSTVSGIVNYSYTVIGVGTKTMHFILDGTEIGTLVTTATGRSQTYQIPEQDYGGHVFECYAEMDLDGLELKSERLRHGMIWIEEQAAQAGIVSTFSRDTCIEGETLTIPYMAYDPLQENTQVQLVVIDENGNQYSSQTLTVDRTPQVWYLSDYPAGNITIRLRCGAARKDFYLNVTPYTLPVHVVTDSLTLEFSAAGRSNGEENPASWSYNDITATFDGFGWATKDGWIADEDGVTALRFMPGDTMFIPFYPFATDARVGGFTVEVEIATRDVRDYESVVLSCLNSGRGFRIASQQAGLMSEQSSVSMLFKEDSHVRVSFSVEDRNLNRLVYIYINGIMCGVTQYPLNDNFQQPTPAGITIGAESCGLDLYRIRCYSKGLTRAEQLDNFICDRATLAEREAAYDRNNILNESDEVAIDKLPASIPYFVIRGPQLPQSKDDDDATVEIDFIDPLHNERSWTATGVKIGIQGTSSAGYPIKNWKFKLKKGIVYSNKKDASGNPVTDVGFPLHEGQIPTKTICWKADFASSENANNVVLAMLYNDLCVYKTPPQEEDARIRQGIDGFPSVLFWTDTSTNTTKFLGKGNCNVDKGNDNIFGLTTAYPHAQSWEFLNNTSDRSLFKSADFTSDGVDKNGNPIKAWQNDFEARYPDDSLEISDFARMAAWVVSTNRDAVESAADKAARLQKFRDEFEDHFILDAMLFYYVFTSTFLLMDNRAKNMFLTTFDGEHWFSLPYDFDSCLGINNEGSLAYEYNLEDTDIVDGDVVYTGQNSVLWNNFRDAFQNEIRDMYVSLRSMSDGDESHESPFSYYRVAKLFKEHQSVWPEALWNEDAFTKYIQPYLVNGEDYLDRLQGDKGSQRDWWLYGAFGYWDSKYQCGDAASKRIILRCYTVADITITPYSHIYGRIRYGSYDTVKRCERDRSYVMECGADEMYDTETYIYSADRISSVGDLSPLTVGEFNSAAAMKLRDIKLGDEDPSYENLRLGAKNSVTVGNNNLLESVNVANCKAFGTGTQKVLDLSGCSSLKTVIATGTKLLGVTLPDGGHLETLKLPATLTNFTILNHHSLETVIFEGYGDLGTLHVENTEGLPIEDLILNNTKLNRVRMINVNWTASGADELQSAYDILSTCGGIDAHGNNTDHAVITGVITVDEEVPDTLIQSFGESFPDVLIIANGHATCVLRFTNWDGTVLYTENVEYGEYAVDPVAAEYIETPTRPDAERIRYTYSGWSRGLTNITSHAIIYAMFSEERAWFAIFQNWDGTELYRELVLTGESAVDPVTARLIQTPERPADTDYSYSYIGWDRSLLNFTADRIITARYATSASLTITFVNYDGEVLYTTHCRSGGSVEDPVEARIIEAPTKPDDEEAQQEFSYVGWNRSLTDITESMTVTAIYSRISYYLATFRNYDSSTLYVEKLRYRQPVVDPVAAEYIQRPQKPPELTYNYIYKGWDTALSTSITENLTYTAQYKTDRQFTVTFLNDGVGINTQYVFDEDDAVDPVTSGLIAEPVRLPTEQYTYTYNGWDKTFTNIKADREVNAVYISTIRKYHIRFLNDDESVISDRGEIDYNTTLTPPETPAHSSGLTKYVFDFWDPESMVVKKDTDYTAVYRDTTLELPAYLGGTLEEYHAEDDTKIILYAFYNHDVLDNVSTNATNIGQNAFYSCDNLKRVEFDNASPVTFGNGVFYYCYNLKELVFHSTTQVTFGWDLLQYTPLLAGIGAIYVPGNLVDTFKTYYQNLYLSKNIFPLDSYPLDEYSTITDSWDEIIAAEGDGSYLQKYSIGDTKRIFFGDTEMYAQIAAFDADELADESGNAKITWITRQALPGTYRHADSSYQYPWSLTDGDWHPGNYHIDSSTAGQSWVITAQTSGDIVVSYRVSSEASYDKFSLYYNGTAVVSQISGEKSGTYTIHCSAGDVFSIQAVYTKDASVSNGSDTVWLSFQGDLDYTTSIDNSGDWGKSIIRTRLSSSTINDNGTDLMEYVKTVKKYSYDATNAITITTDDRLWVPSSREFGFDGPEDKGPQYTGLFVNSTARARRRAAAQYDAAMHWTRSMASVANYYIVDGNGNRSSGSRASNFYITLGFCT